MVNHKKIIRYYANHPSEARELLRTLLGGADIPHFQSFYKSTFNKNLVASRRADEWLTAKEVGERIGMSSRWVRERLQLISDSAKSKKPRGARYQWMINFAIVGEQLQQLKTI